MTAATGWEATLLSRATGVMQHAAMVVAAEAGAAEAAALEAAEARVDKAGPRAILRCMVELQPNQHLLTVDTIADSAALAVALRAT